VGDVVADGPADKAGFETGRHHYQLQWQRSRERSHTLAPGGRNATHYADQTEIVRDGKKKEIKATIGTMPEETAEAPAIEEKSAWGLTAQNLTPELAQRLDGMTMSAV